MAQETGRRGVPDRPSRGDESGFDELYRALWPRAVRAAYRIVGDPGRAEEAAQEAFVRAYDRWRSVSAHPAPAAWVLRVTINVALDAVRRKVPVVAPPETVCIEDQVVDVLAVARALSQLSARQRQTVAMRYFAGATEDEIAAALKMSRGTVKTHLARGVRRLRELLGSEEEDQDAVGPAPR